MCRNCSTRGVSSVPATLQIRLRDGVGVVVHAAIPSSVTASRSALPKAPAQAVVGGDVYLATEQSHPVIGQFTYIERRALRVERDQKITSLSSSASWRATEPDTRM